MNIGRLSNDDGKDNKNVPSYQNEGVVFFFNFFRVDFSLKMANIGELPHGVLGTPPKFGLREEIEFVCLRLPNNVAKGNLRPCS